jgi:hypothetical protein
MSINPDHVIFLLVKHYNCNLNNVNSDYISYAEKELFENFKLSIDNSDSISFDEQLEFEEKFYCREEEVKDASPVYPTNRLLNAVLSNNSSSSSNFSSPTDSPVKKRLSISDEDLEKMSAYYRSTSTGTPRSFASMQHRFPRHLKSPADLKKIRKCFYFLFLLITVYLKFRKQKSKRRY